MLLLIDAGNTRIKWAWVRQADAGADDYGRWSQSGAVSRADWAQLLPQWLAVADIGALQRVLVSNVAGPALREQLRDLVRLLAAASPGAAVPGIEWLASQAALGGLTNGYRQPSQLGCDRFAAAIAAHALFPGEALLVATCGTATTIDAIDPDGRFIGGMILPGWGLMTNALSSNTAQLPQVTGADAVIASIDAAAAARAGAKVQLPFADNTQQAIVDGCIAAQVGAIELALQRHRQAFGNVRCLLAGGAGNYLSPYLAPPHERFDNLVLTGLQVLAAAGRLQDGDADDMSAAFPQSE